MIIYIYQGMMALGKGEIHHEGVEKGNTGQGVGVRNVRNWGQTNAHQKMAPTEFSLFPTSRRY